MSAKDLAAAAVEKGKSIRKAAKEYGVSPSTLYSHLIMLRRPFSAISSAMESVRSKGLTMLGAAKTYGIVLC